MPETRTQPGATYTPPTTRDVATRLVALCREGDNELAIRTLYADDVLSLEAEGPMRETRGLEGVLGKLAWWSDAHEVHDAFAEGPFVHGDAFTVRFKYDVTNRESGQRFVMDEIGHYRVAGGRVVEERFYY